MKTLKFVFAVFLSIIAIRSALVYGENFVKTIQVTYRNISIQVNGRIVASEQEPFIYQDRTFVPLRTIGEALGKTVEWDNGKNQVVINDTPTEKPQSFLSFPIHKLGERIEAYPYAVTVKKAFVSDPQHFGGGNVCVEITLENISEKGLAFKEFSAFSLFDKDGRKYRFSNEVDLKVSHHQKQYVYEAISYLNPGESDTTARICFLNAIDYLNKSLVFVFQPNRIILLDVSMDLSNLPSIEEANVFIAVDLGKLD
jgi:hypothetical protein